MVTEHLLRPTHEAHLFRSSDAPSLDKLLGTRHGVKLDLDRISCLGTSDGSVVGVIAWRPGGIVHELRVGNGLGQKQRADLLVEFAIMDSIQRPFALNEAIFVTDSDRMAAYAESIGAIEEIGKKVFTLDLRRYCEDRGSRR